MSIQVNVLIDTCDTLGETPVWVAEESALWWVDVRRPAVHRYDAATGDVATYPMPELVGSLALHAAGGVVVALRSSIRHFDPATGTLRVLAEPEPGNPQMRLNDGRCDRQGRFWVGSMNDVTRGPEGRLFCLEPGGACRATLDRIMIPNSIAWSLDSRTMFFSGQAERTLFAYDFDPASGTIGERRVLAEYAAPAVPDGAIVDEEGYLWCAAYGGWRIDRFTPEGRLDRTIEVPVQAPTSVAFGGPGLRTLLVTTARQRISEQDLAKQPLAGAVLALDVGVAGVPEPRFAQ